MSNKRITVSDDAGATNWTLPGNTGELKLENAQVDDTVFGQPWDSQNPSLGQWSISANGLFKGVAGYSVVLKKPGTATTMTAEACTLVSGKTYQITAAIKRVISYLDALTVLDNAVDHTADVLSIDYLAGTITFKAAYTPTGPITVTGKYIPLVVMAKAKSFTLTQTCAAIDTSCYDSAQANGGWRTFDPGLNTLKLSVGHIFVASNAWLTTLEGRGIVYVELDLDASNVGKTVARGFFKVGTTTRNGKQGDLEMETVELGLWVPDGALVQWPFQWYFAASALSTALQKILLAFQGFTKLTVTYLPTGATGASPLDGGQGLAVVTNASLANSVDGQNEFTAEFRGDGTLTEV